MIVELEKERQFNYRGKDSEGCTNQSMLLPEPATNKACYYVV